MKNKNSKIKAIFFDVGGVLVKGKLDVVTPAVARIFGTTEKKVHSLVMRNIDGLSTGAETARQFLAHIGDDLNPKKKAKRGAEKMLSEVYAEYRKTNEPVIELAVRLKDAYRVGIISDTIAHHSVVNLRREIYRSFRPVILSFKVHCRKPFKEIFLLALQQVGIAPAEAVFVDDLAKNVMGAKAVGMHAIRFQNIPQLKRDLKKLGVC